MESPRAAVVTLSNLAQGAAVEVFDHELTKVLANIKDPNSDPKTKRKITLVVEFAPFADRSGSEISVSVASKLTPVKAVRSNLFVGVSEGEFKAYSQDIRQQELPLETHPASANVVSMPA